MNTNFIPEDFDFSAALDCALKESLAPIVRLEMLKRRPYLSAKEVRELYGISELSLMTYRSRGGGPSYIQPYDKGRVLYEHHAIVEFLQKGRIKV
jgi:hypothetical protein